MIKLTEEAITQIRESARQTKAEGMALRVAAKKNQDGTFHYAIGFDDVNETQDRVMNIEGIQLVATLDQEALIGGMTIDFVEIESGKQQFIFLNPNDPAYVPPADEQP